MYDVSYLTALLQGPCVGNQLFLASSDLTSCINEGLNSLCVRYSPTDPVREKYRSEVRIAMIVLMTGLIEGLEEPTAIPTLIVSKLQCFTLTKLLVFLIEPLVQDVKEEEDPNIDMPVSASEEDHIESSALPKAVSSKFGRRDSAVDTAPMSEALDVYFLMLYLKAWDNKDGDFPTESATFERRYPMM